MLNSNNKKTTVILFYAIIFIFLFIFFTNIHPLVIYDADDWTYISLHREFIPLWGAWNPSKLFPETLMPLCGSVAAFVVNPIVHNYLKSITIVTSFLVSFMITLYIYMFVKMIKVRFKLPEYKSLFLGALFFLFHFLLLVVGSENNQYMFFTHNVNCYYNYLIPNLLNFIMVFYFISKEKMDFSLSSIKDVKSGILLLLIYISIFSNLLCNIVIGVYAGVEVLIHFLEDGKKKSIIEFFKKYFILILILISWLVSVIYELSGGRAKVKYPTSVISGIYDSIRKLGYSLVYNVNRLLLITFVIIIIIFLINIFKEHIFSKNKKKAIFYLKYILYIVVITLYYILICPKIGPDYILRIEDVYGIYAYCLVFVFICLAYILKKHPKIIIIFPIVICFCAIELNGSIKTLKESNTSNISPLLCEKIDNDMIKQIKQADIDKKSKIEVHVIDNNNNDNWPQATYMGRRISHTLYKHGIIKKQIDITIVPDKEKNKELLKE